MFLSIRWILYLFGLIACCGLAVVGGVGDSMSARDWDRRIAFAGIVGSVGDSSLGAL